MTIFERAEGHTGMPWLGKKTKRKEEDLGQKTGMCKQRKLGRSSTPRVSILADQHWHCMMFQGRCGIALLGKSGYTQSHKWPE